ncbi:hypothetical protein KJ903_03685 [Patescibacteria group bacterium]|nr:hypothetical protein [Patescibacteria group bacterium]
MIKKVKISFVLLVGVLVFSGCSIGKYLPKDENNVSQGKQNQDNSYVTDRTDYTIYYTASSPAVLGGATIQQNVVGHPIPEAETIKYNAYLVPWRIDFSQVQRTSLSSLAGACDNLTEQVIYIDGWIDLDLSELEVGSGDLPNSGPVNLKGTVHEKVTGTPGVWQCGDSNVATLSANGGSAQYVQSVSGDHSASFSGASNLTDLTVEGANIYLDLSYESNIQFIWPAGTKIEYAPAGTPIPVEPLPSSSL